MLSASIEFIYAVAAILSALPPPPPSEDVESAKRARFVAVGDAIQIALNLMLPGRPAEINSIRGASTAGDKLFTAMSEWFQKCALPETRKQLNRDWHWYPVLADVMTMAKRGLPLGVEVSVVPSGLAIDVLWSLNAALEPGPVVDSSPRTRDDAALDMATAEDLSNQIRDAAKTREVTKPPQELKPVDVVMEEIDGIMTNLLRSFTSPDEDDVRPSQWGLYEPTTRS
jgi:hypothetical protein